MTLLYITNQICGPGGLERVLSIKARFLAEKLNYDVHILTLNQEGLSLFYDFGLNITFHDITVKGNFFTYFRAYRKGIKKVFKDIRPDIISVCDDGLKGFFLPLILGKPCTMVYERHASINISKNKDKLNLFQQIKFKLLKKTMHYGAKYYDAFVVLTNGNLEEWKLNKLHVIPNPLSFYSENCSTLTNKKVIAVGNHGFQKGYDRLLQSWKSVNNKHPNWKLEIYGKIDTKEKHIELAKELDIINSISFFNPVKNIQDKYVDSSIYVMSSRSEGFGMVLIEAMALGLPCISFDCPSGPRDIITHNKDGFLIKDGDISSFSRKIIDLIEGKELRMKMGGQARIKAKNYLPEAIVPKWDKLFLSLIETKK